MVAGKRIAAQRGSDEGENQREPGDREQGLAADRHQCDDSENGEKRGDRLERYEWVAGNAIKLGGEPGREVVERREGFLPEFHERWIVILPQHGHVEPC